MKKFISIFILIALSYKAFPQWITQSAEGKGSFLFKGSNVAFDLAKTNLSFTVNNLNEPFKVPSPKDNRFTFYGITASAKNQEGLANLLSNSDFVPFTNVNGYIGIQFSNSYDGLYRQVATNISAEIQRLTILQIEDFVETVGRLIVIELQPVRNASIGEKLENDWSKALSSMAPHKFLKYLQDYKTEDVSASNIRRGLISQVKAIIKENDDELARLNSEILEIRNEAISQNLKQFSVFLFGGVDASSFKRVEEVNTTSLSDSFVREDFRGGNFGLGINYQVGSWKFGFTYAYKATNNFNLLDKTEYKLTTTYAAEGQTLTQEKNVTAYSGTYDEVSLNEMNIDVLYTVGISRKENTYAMINAYLRGNFNSGNREILSDSYNLGLGGYFFGKESKFLGGLYLELPDVENSLEKRKPEENQEIKPAHKRLTFGIAAKFSLNSLLALQ